MELPEHIQHLVGQLGQALIQAISTDPRSRELARLIHEGGFEVAVMADATVILRKRDTEGDSPEASASPAPPLHIPLAHPEAAAPEVAPDPSAWSEDDRAFLHRFKISLD